MPTETPSAPGSQSWLEDIKGLFAPILADQIDVALAATLTREELRRQVGEIALEIASERGILLSQAELNELVPMLINATIRLDPPEPNWHP